MSGRDLRQCLQNGLLVGDGAMATYLYQQGIPVGICYEELSLTQPDVIRSVHRAYYEAGARLIETNTYGANRERLERYGLAGKVTRINREAVAVARSAVDDDAFVVGSIGSILAGRVPHYDTEAYRDMYEEQATALLHAGVDGIVLETFLDLEELLLAVEVIRPLTDRPIIAQLALMEVARTRDAYTLDGAFAHLAKSGVDGVGFNCRLGPTELLRALEQTVMPTDLWISVFPNAGRLGLVDGNYEYQTSPAYFGESALRLREQGVRIIGGCCGTTPAHIRAMAESLRDLPPLPRVNPKNKTESSARRVPIHLRQRNKPTIVERVQREYTVIVELDPPKDLETSSFLEGAARLHAAGAAAITMADNSLATTRMSNMALGAIVKSQLGIDPLVHITCRDRNLIGQQSHVMGLHALGIDQVLVITGDPTRIGDLPGASSIYDVTSFELIRMLKQLNEGISFSGKPLKQRAQFVVGAAFNPHVRHLDAAVRRLEKKVEAGADFIMTQPVYDADGIRQIAEATAHLDIPVFIGIMPLTGYRNALFLHNEVPGIKIPSDVLERMKDLKGEEGRKMGVAIARELLDVAMAYFRGIYLITPFAYWQMTEELTRYVLRAKQNALVQSAGGQG
ncbi:bifunctional homocysteine S-methyltransferase/5,10-methylenetetrahydrofolate reductase [Polycladomyces abyssicola]|uniref:Bifunctional homocysteine S-methyltransferase/5,10-methylenetetrahydrofolate reductase n=1 Tax=Polycladomyces abyssicola TaxID=1125966 RepID=A0A8D5UH51_9BACL|nr:bifunctional homocysteine S-methyltransferase/methylenetetrahydrofolate reductase [Polycladomyces abyssicola]BCU83059.1 bifunctional homocysteine S-methyltransferase/5,10-methylenetetrahydrofolate reductase [Polycladomyces abyssicola]